MTQRFSNCFVALVGLAALALVACGSEDESAQTGGARGVFINELMPDNDTVYEDPDATGEYDDWIELYNDSDSDADLSGCFISDDPDNPQRHELPEGTTVRAGGVLLLLADRGTEQGPLHLSFALDRSGEGVWLTDSADNLVDSVEFGLAPGEYSFARFPDGTGDFEWCAVPSPDELNGSACETASNGSGGAAGAGGA